MSIHFVSDVAEVSMAVRPVGPMALEEVFRQQRALCHSEGRRCVSDCLRRQLGLCGLSGEN